MPDLAPTPPTPPDDHDFAAVWNRVVSRPGWRAATPQKNSGGLFRAEHVKTGLVFVLLPPGEFTMGSTDGGAYERPPHRVRIGKPFLMCEMECTQGAWTKGGGTNDSKFTGARLPVEQVSWTDAREWCQRNGFRLPSEAEWEYACRAGNPGRFGFGDEDGRLSDFGWHKDNSSNRTHEVAGLKPNGWGLFDMHGNVWEWCEDRYHDDYEGAPGDGSAWVDGGTPARVFRGGSWDFPAGFCRSAFRLRWSPSGRVVDLGFRPAISVP
jgi:formylglycine-generating enzyme required for sulfatase activity